MEAYGEPIAGSMYVRCFCEHCGSPMRCPQNTLDQEHHVCGECLKRVPPAHTGLVARQRAKLGKTSS